MATLKDLLDSGMSREEINAILSQQFVGTDSSMGSPAPDYTGERFIEQFSKPPSLDARDLGAVPARQSFTGYFPTPQEQAEWETSPTGKAMTKLFEKSQPDFMDARDLGAISTGGGLPPQEQTIADFFKNPQPPQPVQQYDPGYAPAGTVEQAAPNTIRNNSTGRVFQPTDINGQPSKSQPSGPALDYSSPIEIGGYGKGYRLKGDATRAVMGDGRIVDMGRDTGAERARMKEDLGIQKQRAELAQLQAKPGSSSEAAMAKILAEVQGDKIKSQIPGTTEYERVQKRDAGVKKEESAWSGSVKQADQMIDYIDSIVGEGKYKGKGSKLGFFSTGLPGQVLQNVGGTDARNLRGDLDRIKANIGFEELNKMRRESPTGGALGQVTERELQFLQSVQGALDQAQTPEQLDKMLYEVKLSTQRLKSDLLKNPPKGFSGSGAPAKFGAEQQAILMQEAKKAIAAGAPRNAVMQRVQ